MIDWMNESTAERVVFISVIGDTSIQTNITLNIR